MTIGQPNQVPNIDPKLLTNERQLIGERDIDIPKRIFRQLGQLGSACIGQKDLRAAKCLIECFGRDRGLGRKSTGDPVV